MRGPMITPEHGEVVEVVDQHELTTRSTKDPVFSGTERASGDDSSLEGQDGQLSVTKSTQQDAAGMRRTYQPS